MDSSSECLLALHWLPIRSRINHKILTLVQNCIMGSAPEYLQNLLVVHKPGRPGLRSALDTNLRLVVPFVRCKTFAERSFSIQGPKCGTVYWRFLEAKQTLMFLKEIKNPPVLLITTNLIMLVKLNLKFFLFLLKLFLYAVVQPQRNIS